MRSIESLLGLRVDHLVMLELSGFTRVIDVVGGVTVQNRMETAADGWHFGAGELRLNGTEASVFLGSSKQSMWTLERTQAVFIEIVRGIVGGDALTNPAKVETIGQVLRTCVTVDAALTPGEIRRMALDVHLTSDAIKYNGTPLPLAGVSDMNGSPVIVADAARIPELTDALTKRRHRHLGSTSRTIPGHRLRTCRRAEWLVELVETDVGPGVSIGSTTDGGPWLSVSKTAVGPRSLDRLDDRRRSAG